MNEARIRGGDRGVVTLAMTLILLVLVTMVSIYTSRTVLFEQRISGNDFRSRQAFEAAESGLRVALAYLGSRGGADKNDDGAMDPVFDTDADGIGDTNSVTFADLSSVTVTVTGAVPSFQIVSVGVSDDSTATRTVRTVGAAADGLPNPPGNPLTARGPVVIDGSATIYNPEGNSTIWSGEAIDLGSNNSTATEIADPTDPGYPACLDTSMTCSTVTSSNRVASGLDVIENDTSLSNLTAQAMFQYFFGLSMENYRASRVTLDVAAADVNNLASNLTNPGVQLATGEIVWVEGNAEFNNNTTIGCTVVVVGNNLCTGGNIDPSIVIVNGDLVGLGTPNVTGLLYVIGNFDLQGNVTNQGAIIVQGNLLNDASGSLDVRYNSDVLSMTRDNGPLVGSPGSWQDW
ncbi:MAG: pilus assembly PilX N-terminal domain-containing protein [Gammaproteobacteria bacterium]|jgi:hypothetical protein